MKKGKTHIISGSLLTLLLGASLTFSTLHSHHHLQWQHSDDYTETGNCITADTTLCPVCGYHVKSVMPGIESQTGELTFHSVLVETACIVFVKEPVLAFEGRSPPV